MKKVLVSFLSILFGFFICNIAFADSIGAGNLSADNNVSQVEAETSIKIFDKMFTVAVIEDNVPLQSIPYNDGLTVLQYYDKGITLNVVGEYNGFYKVMLARDDFAWIDKSLVTKIEGYDNTPASIENFVYEELPNERVYKIKLNKKVPYVLSETIYYKTKQYKSFVKYSDGLDLIVYNVKNYPENKYEFHINNLGTKDFGYKIYYKNNNELIISVKNFPIINSQKPLEGIKVVIAKEDIKYPFKKCPCLTNVEDDVTSKTLQKLKELLEKSGAEVLLSEDNNIADDTDIFISLHNELRPVALNAIDPVGVNVFYYCPQSSSLASKIEDSLSYQTGLKSRGVEEKNTKSIRNTAFPAVYIELSYLINSSEHFKMEQEDFPQTVAKAILKGIVRYINDK